MTVDTMSYAAGTGSDIGVFELELGEYIPVANLRALLEIIEATYYAHAIVGWAERQHLSFAISERFEPLVVELLEIGTPNKAKFRGKLKDLSATVTLLGTLLGIPVSIGTAYGLFMAGEKTRIENDSARRRANAEVRKTEAEADKIEAEAEKTRADVASTQEITRKTQVDAALAQLEVLKNAGTLRQKKLLSDEQYKELTRLPERISVNANAASAIVPDQKVELIRK